MVSLKLEAERERRGGSKGQVARTAALKPAVSFGAAATASFRFFLIELAVGISSSSARSDGSVTSSVTVGVSPHPLTWSIADALAVEYLTRKMGVTS